MFTKSASFYDAIYAAIGKDDAHEAQMVHDLVQQHKHSPGKRLLDVACGTGHHLVTLEQWYEVEGLDLDPRMLAIARRRCPGVRFHRGDLATFKLPQRFDVVTCLFSSIGYAGTVQRLNHALRTMSRHVVPGGVVVVEPWITPEKFEEGHLGAVFVDQRDLKIARINSSTRKAGVSVLRFHYLVGTPSGITRFTESHRLGLFAHERYVSAFREAGLDVIHDPEGLIGRGLYIGVRRTN